MNKEYPEVRIIDWAKEYLYEAQYFIMKSFRKLYSRELLDCLLFSYAGVERILKFIIAVHDPVNIINRGTYEKKYALLSDYSRSFATLGFEDCYDIVSILFPKLCEVSDSINKLGSYRNTIQHASLVHHKYKDVFEFMVYEMPKIVNALSEILEIENIELAGDKFRFLNTKKPSEFYKYYVKDMIKKYKNDWENISRNDKYTLSEYKKSWYNHRNSIKAASCPICGNMGEYKIKIDYDGLAPCEFWADGYLCYFCGLDVSNSSEEGAYFDIYTSFLVGKSPKVNLNPKFSSFEFGFDSDYKKEILLLKILDKIPK